MRAAPPLTPSTVGYGAGGADTPGRANVVQVVIGTAAGPAEAGAGTAGSGQPMVELAANVDDATGEVLAHTVGRAPRRRGQRRLGDTDRHEEGTAGPHRRTRCATRQRSATVGAVLVAESGSLGLRATAVERWPQARDEITVDVGGHRVRVKRAEARVKAEHDDAAAAAAALGRPLREVLAEAEGLAAQDG